MKYTFQYFTDIATSADSMQVMTIAAGGSYLLQRVRHLMPAYKYMKMGKVSVKLLPASTLPVDPLYLSYDTNDTATIDPRDQMNPGLVRITNGEDIFTDVSSLNDDTQMQIYNNMMLDPRWSKFMLQSGFRRSARPLYWQVGQLHQDNYPGIYENMPLANTSYSEVIGTVTQYASSVVTTDATNTTRPNINYEAYSSSPRGFFQTGHKGRMGWIPTDSLYELANKTDGGTSKVAMPNAMPCINCITVVLPKAYKTLYYYRLFVTETVYFSGVKNFGIADDSNVEFVGIDNFLRPGPMFAAHPDTAYQGALTYKSNQGDGYSNSVNCSLEYLNSGEDPGDLEDE